MERSSRAMSDEIENANVIKIRFVPWPPRNSREGYWTAEIGPGGGRGIKSFGTTAVQAVTNLVNTCRRSGWVFDETWTPDNE
jgi:hypothetical protein